MHSSDGNLPEFTELAGVSRHRHRSLHFHYYSKVRNLIAKEIVLKRYSSPKTWYK